MNFKGEVLSRTKVRNNIVKTFELSKGKLEFDNWYIEANSVMVDIAFEFGMRYSVEQITAITAAFSPLKTWSQNIKMTRRFLEGKKGGHFKSAIKKAEAILELGVEEDDVQKFLDILNGNKISSFFMNILQPNNTSVVTIDRHAISIALGRVSTQKEQSLTKNQYEFFVQCYVWTAEQLGITPSELQGRTWSAWRGSAE